MKLRAYKSLAGKIDLSDVFCLKEFRVVGSDHTVSIKGVRYFIADELRHSIYKQKLQYLDQKASLTEWL